MIYLSLFGHIKLLAKILFLNATRNTLYTVCFIDYDLLCITIPFLLQPGVQQDCYFQGVSQF